MKKDLNKRLRELREKNTPITLDFKRMLLFEYRQLFDKQLVKDRYTSNSIERAMLSRKTFQEILSEKMEKIAVLEKEIFKRN